MAIPKNIKKKHLLEAIKKIDAEGIPQDGDSRYYDVIFNNKRYPPKVIVSYANLFANGEILERDTFEGGEGTASFKLLKKNEFLIEKKSAMKMSTPAVWFVTQGATFTPERGMKFLWAPAKAKDARPRFYWDNLLRVKKGDIIFNYSRGIRGVSIALSDGYHAKNDNKQSNWGNEGYKVDLRLIDLNPIIPPSKLVEKKSELKNLLSEISKQPFDINGNVNEGYLYEFTKEAGYFIRDLYGEIFNDAYIDEFFDSITPNPDVPGVKRDLLKFEKDISKSGLVFDDKLLLRFIASLLTKPFLILTGLSGSGKTKLAQAFTQWICQDESQYRIIPVGADWTNREPLLGYPNALNPEEYVKPDSGVLDLIIDASNEENSDKPYFLILDEMNLSQVERYFADFLSAMESKEEIPLYAEGTVENGVPAKLCLPSNLFIIGTVNIDETTNMFSPKVLDRANTIEFRVTKDEMTDFLKNIKDLNMDALKKQGSAMAKNFLEMARNKSFATEDVDEINETLVRFFGELKKTGAEFGYRTATEILRLIYHLSVLNNTITTKEKVDIAIMQKLLPKLHGSRRKLSPVLATLGRFCIEGDVKIEKDVFEKDDFDFNGDEVLYPLSLEKIKRMYKGAVDNGFTSFAEA